MNELERAVVGGSGFPDAIEPAEELGARRMQIRIAVELEALHEGERGLDVARFGDGAGLVELDDR